MPKRKELPYEVVSGLEPGFSRGNYIHWYPYYSPAKFLFRRPSCHHPTFCTIRSFHDKVLNNSTCLLCTGRTMSRGEVLLRVAVAEVFGGEVFTVEDKVVQGFVGSVDVFIPRYSLIVQYDGVQHFDKAHHQTAAACQWEIDQRLNCMAFEQGFRVLRIHHDDAPDLGAVASLLWRVKVCCSQWHGRNFVWWSQSFGTPMTWGCKLLQV